MTSSKNSVQPLDLDDLERQLREVAVSSIPRKSDDPLAELARIVGRDNPPRAASGEAQSPAASPYRAGTAAGMRESDRAFDLEASIKDALGAEPAYRLADDEAEEPAFEEDEHEIPDEEEAHSSSRDWEEENYDADAAYAGEAGGFDDIEQVPGMPGEVAPDAPARRGFISPRALALAVPLVLIGVGVGAAVVMRAGPMSRITGEAPVIKADDTPVKVLPTKTAGDQETPSETALGAADPSGKASQVVLAGAEQPVDVVAAAKAAQPRDPVAAQPPAGSGIVILSGQGAGNASAPADASASSGPAPSAAPSTRPLPTAAANVALPEPPQPAAQISGFGTVHRVMTVAVKPDEPTVPNSKPKVEAKLDAKAEPRNEAKPEVKADVAPAPAKPPMTMASAETTPPASAVLATTSATPAAKKPADATHAKPSAVVSADDQQAAQSAKPSKPVAKPVKPKPAESASAGEQGGTGAPLSITPQSNKGRATIARAEPVNPEAAASASNPTASASDPTASAASHGAFAQVASSQSESDARATLARLQKQFPNELGGGAIHRADLGSKGIYYRVQVGPLSREAADKICTQIKAGGAQCIRTGG
jgi:SPOR domain